MNHRAAQHQPAFGAPGINPRWTRSDKGGIVSAYSASSRIWATLSAGIVNEVYSPSIDSPQIRDLQFLLTDGATFFHDERRNTQTETTRISGSVLGYRITNRDPDGDTTHWRSRLSQRHTLTACCCEQRSRSLRNGKGRSRYLRCSLRI